MSDSDIPATASPRTIGLLLIDGFALMSYASLIEPFRAANVLAGRILYRWTHISRDGRAATASNGASILADHKVGDALACDMLFLFAGGNPADFADAATFHWLRRLAANGIAIGGASGGPFLMARAGLLDGHRATIHWEHAASFREAFPMLALESGLYVIDRRRMTCAGGMAGLDLAVELIERDHGPALAAQVGEWFISAGPRHAEKPQRASLRERYAVTNDRVVRALAAMEAHVDEPRDRTGLAALTGVSPRQLERLFQAHLGTTVGAMYLRIRLDKGASLLRSTSLSVTQVAIACGFTNASHFSRSFKARLGMSPSAARR